MTANFFLVQLVEHWKMPSRERNIPEHDIIQRTQITTEKYFFLPWLGYGAEINRHSFWLDKHSK